MHAHHATHASASRMPLLVFALGLLPVLNLAAQAPPTLGAPHLTASPGSTITVPVQVSGFQTVGAITLFLTYDAAVLTFQSAQAMAIPGMEVNSFVQEGVGTVAMSWSAASGSNLPNGTLVQYLFQYNGGSSPLSFDPAYCEVAALVGGDIQVLDLVLEDGSVQPENSTTTGPDRSAKEEPRVAVGEGALIVTNPTDAPLQVQLLDASGRTLALHQANGRGTFRWPIDNERNISLYRLLHQGQVRAGKPNLMVTP